MTSPYTDLIARMNDVLSWELAGIIQNLNHSVLLTGTERKTFGSMFGANSEENRTHAEMISQKIAALGGIPTVEPAKIRQAIALEDMLEAALALEEDAMVAWEAAWKASKGAPQGTQLWFENMLTEEQEHIDELRLLTGKVAFSAKALSEQSKAG